MARPVPPNIGTLTKAKSNGNVFAKAKTAPRTKTVPKAMAPRSAPAPRKAAPNYSGGGSAAYSPPATSYPAAQSMAAPMSVAPPPAAPTAKKWEELGANEQTDYLKGDATYVAQQAALQSELQNLLSELALQRTNYDADHNNALRNLGWSQERNDFDPENPLGAYGAAYNNQENDFASRGMLDSSAFSEALTNLDTSFDKQLGDINSARTRFGSELDMRKQSAENTRKQDEQRARADAIARRAASLGLV
jgi:hypothetical protein